MFEDVDPRALGKDTTGEVCVCAISRCHAQSAKPDRHRSSSTLLPSGLILQLESITGAKRGHRDESRIEDGENDTEVRDFSAD